MGGQTAVTAAFQRKALEGKIKGLVAGIYKLAPNPSNEQRRGPLFISLKSQFKPAAEYDGMLGSVFMDALLGPISGICASNDNGASSCATPMASMAYNLDLQTYGDALSELLEYQQESEKERQKAAEKGRGSFALGEHKTICGRFNEESAEEHYQRDLPKRLRLEAAVASLCKKADLLAREEKLAVA